MITNYLANQYLNVLTGRVSNASLGAGTVTSYVGLSTTKPNKAGEGITEVSGNGYSRTLIGKTSSNGSSVDDALLKMSKAENGITSNTAIIYFPEATGAWGVCTYLCVFNQATNGVLLAYSPILNYSFESSSISSIDLDYEIFADQVNDVAGTYEIQYDGAAWKLNASEIDITKYGIKLEGTPEKSDEITITFGVSPTTDQVPIIRVGQLKMSLN